MKKDLVETLRTGQDGKISIRRKVLLLLRQVPLQHRKKVNTKLTKGGRRDSTGGFPSLHSASSIRVTKEEKRLGKKASEKFIDVKDNNNNNKNSKKSTSSSPSNRIKNTNGNTDKKNSDKSKKDKSNNDGKSGTGGKRNQDKKHHGEKERIVQKNHHPITKILLAIRKRIIRKRRQRKLKKK